MEKKEKPITLRIEDFKNNLVDLINESGLPIFIIEPLMGNVYKDIVHQYNAQIIKDEQEYRKEEFETNG